MEETPHQTGGQRDVLSAVSSLVALDFAPMKVLSIHSPAPRHPWRYAAISMSCAFILFWAAMIMMVSVVAPRLMGYATFITPDTAMAPSVNNWTQMLVKPMWGEKVKGVEKGDVLVYLPDPRLDLPRIGRVRDIEGSGGQAIYTIRGDAQPEEETMQIPAAQVRGLVEYQVPVIGAVGLWLTENMLSMLLVLESAVILSFAGWEIGTALINRRDPQAVARKARLRAAAAAARLEAIRREGR